MKINQEIKDIIFKRLLITISILLFIRMGTFLPVPGINHNDLAFYIQTHSGTKNLINTFSGNDTFVIGLFTLNIFPYINASILVQLMVGLIPKFAKLQKEGDIEGRRYIIQLTRFITLILAVIQSSGLALYLKQVLFDWTFMLAFEIIIWLTTGAIIVLWLSEFITDYGLGNGASLLIYINIISSLPNLTKVVFLDNINTFTISVKFGIAIIIFFSLYGIVFLQEGLRIIPLISSKQLNKSFLKDSTVTNNYLPLRLNQAGVMPIILTTAALVIPSYFQSLGLFFNFNLTVNLTILQILYWISYFTLVLLFSSFYSTLVLNPKDISDQLQKMSVTIPGIRPGIQTTFYLKQTMKRITLIGAMMLATLAIIPNFLESTLNITNLNGLSTTSLLILAGVVLDLSREVENIYYSNVYNSMYQ